VNELGADSPDSGTEGFGVLHVGRGSGSWSSPAVVSVAGGAWGGLRNVRDQRPWSRQSGQDLDDKESANRQGLGPGQSGPRPALCHEVWDGSGE